jgi:hypothetical protein
MKKTYAIVLYPTTSDSPNHLKGIIVGDKLLHPTKAGLYLTLGTDTAIIKTFNTKKELLTHNTDTI